MMARKNGISEGYPTTLTTAYESEGSGSSGRIDMEVTVSERSCPSRRKWINLNSASQDGFSVPIQVIPVSKLTPPERKSLVLRLKSELEQIQLIQKKMESHRVNAVAMSSSGNILSNRNAQNGPPGGKTNRSLGLNSGSGKKSGTSGQKARGWNRGVTGRFQSVSKTLVTDPTTAALFKQCDSLLKKLMSHKFGFVFNKPVDIVELNIPDYFDVIKHPMDLGTIKTKLECGDYSSPLDFLADVRLTFSNAMTYNPPANDVHAMADTLSKFFEARWKPIQKKIPVNNSHSMSERSVVHDEIEMVDPVAPSKKRKLLPIQDEIEQRNLSPEQPEVVSEPTKLKMTDEEKYNLSRDLESSIEDLPDNLTNFLKEQSSNGREAGDGEIEIDIDNLSDDTLLTLRKLLDDFLHEKQVNSTKAETCEIELPNESGLSNSSMQLDKGSGHADDDVDIGGNLPTGASYPLVETEKDAVLVGNKSSNAESIDGNSDSDSSSSSDSESDSPEESMPAELVKDDDGSNEDCNRKPAREEMVNGNQLVSAVDQLEQNYQQNSNSEESEFQQGGDSAPTESQVSPGKLYRAALLRNRFADTILKAREKTLSQGDKVDPEKLRREREELEVLKRKEKARLQAEAKAAEDARKQAEAEAAAEAKRRRELEREAARQALLQMEKTVEINENSRFLEDLEMLSGAVPLEHLPSSVDEISPDDSQDGLGSFKFGASNPLEQLGLYMKMDDEDEEPEPPNHTNVENDVEEGEID